MTAETQPKPRRDVMGIVAVVEGVLLALLVIAFTILIFKQAGLYAATTRQQAVTACQSRQIGRLTAALITRADLGDKSRNAAVAYNAAVARDRPGSGTLATAVASYDRSIVAINAGLAANPVPAERPCT